MASTRPVRTFYGYDRKRRASALNCKGFGHSTKLANAILAATRRILAGDFNRCDIFNEYGIHSRTIVCSPNRVTVTITKGIS